MSITVPRCRPTHKKRLRGRPILMLFKEIRCVIIWGQRTARRRTKKLVLPQNSINALLYSLCSASTVATKLRIGDLLLKILVAVSCGPALCRARPLACVVHPNFIPPPSNIITPSTHRWSCLSNPNITLPTPVNTTNQRLVFTLHRHLCPNHCWFIFGSYAHTQV